MIKEQELVKNIIISSDWEEVITNIVIDENMDPWSIDIIKLTDAFVTYLNTLKFFDFRIPARFILVAAILLRMKCDILLEEEKERREEKEITPLEISHIKSLEAPIKRVPKRKVKITELVQALQKAFAFKEKKKMKKIKLKRTFETIIKNEEDIEKRTDNLMKKINSYTDEKIAFSSLVGTWTRKNIIYVFLPLLHLLNAKKIFYLQERFFDEIFIFTKKPGG